MAEAGGAEPTRRQQLVQSAVRSWSNQLIDISGRNQLLYYRTLKRGTLELTSVDPRRLAEFLAGTELRLAALAPEEDAVKRASAVQRKAQEGFEERGLQTLFVAHGMATWTTEATAATPAAPVLMRPVVLTPRGAARNDFDIQATGDWEVNGALLHLLRTQYSVQVDDEQAQEWVDAAFTQRGIDAGSVFAELGAAADEVPDFAVSERVVVGNFAYAKQPMVNDLAANVAALAEHDLIAAMAGDADGFKAIAGLRAAHVPMSQPDDTPPADEFLILDSDASQNWAINRALAGEPLIIQGPPGTGKSQTIANLIATLTARGKRVLFVAEKRAAIDAVTKRLDQAGLDDLVLDLHGGVGSKKQFAQELSRTLQGHGSVLPPDLRDVHRELAASRDSLREHNDALHEEREPWGLSAYQVNERLLELSEVPDITRFSAGQLRDLDTDTAAEVEERLRTWAHLAGPVISADSPWGDSRITTEEEALRALELVNGLADDRVPRARRQLDRVVRQSGLPAPGSVGAWQRALALLRAVATTLAVVAPEVFRLDLDQVGADLAPAGRSWWSRLVAQLFDARYRAAKRQVAALWVGTDKPSGPESLRAVEQARAEAAQWRELGGTGAPRLPEQLGDAESSYRDLLDDLAALGAFLVGSDLTAGRAEDLADEVSELLADQRTLLLLPHVHELRTWLLAHHGGALLRALEHGQLPADSAVDAFRATWLRSIRDEVTAGDARLITFEPQLQDSYAERFQRSDRQHLATTPDRIRRAVAENAVRVRNEHPEQDLLVRREAGKRSRHIPLRRLFAEAPDVLLALRPCWTMSPLVVSHLLPAQQMFDVVIFDEASQVMPADAVPALLRAPQAVVAGDSRQLPPTSFFGIEVEDEEEGDEAGLTSGFESILDVLDVFLQSLMLTWHYRSQDERLIGFSNHEVYDSALTTFPGTTGDDALSFELVPHIMGSAVDSRSNGDEVELVVQRMIDHARARPRESLGVIAMGSHHANRIEATLQRRLRQEQDPALDAFFDDSAPERAFVKNIERVQGDERDAIILTTGYAKTPDGRLRYNFGALNNEGGERRLNVAVTRARRRMSVISSFAHTDMDPGRSSSQGPELLRKYLRYAASGGTELEGAERSNPAEPVRGGRQAPTGAGRPAGRTAVRQFGLPDRLRREAPGPARGVGAGCGGRRRPLPLQRHCARPRPTAAAGPGAAGLAVPPDLVDGLVRGPADGDGEGREFLRARPGRVRRGARHAGGAETACSARSDPCTRADQDP